MPVVHVPAARFTRWVENFVVRHGATTVSTEEGALLGLAEDGSRFRARLPFHRAYPHAASVDHFVASAVPPSSWGVLLVRKGGFAVARLDAGAVVASKVGQRHVQGRSKAGGQSQQRFARRRDNQARQAYEAAAGHAARVLDGLVGPLAIGGDRAALDEVLNHPSLRHLETLHLPGEVPEPRRAALEAAIALAESVEVSVHNA